MVIFLKHGLLETVLHSQPQPQSQKPTKTEVKSFRAFLKKLPEEFQEKCFQIISKNKTLDINSVMEIEKNTSLIKQTLFSQMKINHSYSTITKDLLYFQISNTRNLKELNISYCAKLQDIDILSILNSLKLNSPNIEILNFSGLSISDRTLIKTLEYFPFLKSFSINDCTALTDGGMGELISWIANNNNLKVLNIAGLTCINPDLLIPLISILKNIEELNISRLTQLNELYLSNILDSLLKNSLLLRSFQAAETNINSSHLKIIESADKLTILNLNKCKEIKQDALIEFFDSFDSIQQLSIAGLPVCNSLLKKILLKNRSLQSLDIEDCKEITSSGFTEACLHFERSLYPLYNLNLASLKLNFKVLFSGLSVFPTCLKKLEKLDLSFLPINARLLSLIAFHCKNLKHLSLAGMTVLDRDLASFFREFGKKNFKLKSINLNSVIFKGGTCGLKTFSSIAKNFKTIRHITVKGSNIQNITVFSSLLKTNNQFMLLFFDIPEGVLSFEKESREVPDVISILEDNSFYFPKYNDILMNTQFPRIQKATINSVDKLGKEWLQTMTSRKKNLDFFGNWSLNSSKLNCLLRSQRNIESLDLSTTILSDADVLKAIRLLKEFSPNLQFLSLQRLPIFNETLLLVFESFPKLKGIDLSNLLFVDDDICEPFINWIKSNSNLESLGLPTSLSPDSIESIVEATSHLNALSMEALDSPISLNYLIADSILKHLSNSSPNLKKLNLAYANSFESLIEKLPDYFPELIDLALPGMRIKNCGKTIARWPNLKVLKFFSPTNEDFIEIAESNIQLMRLSLLTLDNLNDETFKSGLEIIGQKNCSLEALQFTAWDFISSISSEAYFCGLHNIKNILPNIKWLQLDSSNFDDNCLALLAEHCMSLRQLNISGSKITGQGFLKNMKIIGENNPIEYLSIGLTDLSDSNMLEVLEPLIQNFHDLKFLSFCSGIGIESQTICEMIPFIVRANPNLQSISVFQSVDIDDLQELITQYPEIASLIINAPDFSRGAHSCQWGHGYGIRRY